MYGFLYDSVSNFILIKKFKLIVRWYLYIREPKRLLSFKKWLFRKWSNSNYLLSNFSINRKSSFFDINKGLWNIFFLSSDLYFSRNYGLDFSFGYFNFIDDNCDYVYFGKFFKLNIQKNISLLYKLSNLNAIRDFWSSHIVYKFKKLLTNFNKKRLFFSNNYFNKFFLSNHFMRKLWYGRFFFFKNVKLNRKTFFKEKFLYSKFNFRFLKYMFFISYSKSLSLSYNFLLSKINLNVLSFILAPKFKKILSINNMPVFSNKILSNIVENNFFSSLFGGWSNKIFLYSPVRINKYYMKVLFILKKFGYPFLKKNQYLFFKNLTKRSFSNLKKSNFSYWNVLKKYKKFSIKHLSLKQFTNFINFYSKYLFINRKFVYFYLFKFNLVNKNFYKFINKFIRGPFYSFGFRKIYKSGIYKKKISKLWSWVKSISKKSDKHLNNSRFLFCYGLLYKKIKCIFKKSMNIFIFKLIFFFLLLKYILNKGILNFSKYLYNFFILLYKYLGIFNYKNIKKLKWLFRKISHGLNFKVYNIILDVKLFNFFKFLRSDYLYYLNNYLSYNKYLSVSFNSFLWVYSNYYIYKIFIWFNLNSLLNSSNYLIYQNYYINYSNFVVKRLYVNLNIINWI